MKHRIFLMLFLPAVLLLTGCEDDSDVLLNCTIKQMTYDHEGGSQTLIIESDADWSIYGLPDWISTSVYSGIRTQEVTLTTKKNWTGLDRLHELTIRTNDGKRIWPLKVLQYASPEGRQLSVDDYSEKFFNGKASLGTYDDSIVVSSTIRWTITGPEWMDCTINKSVSPMNGELKEGSAIVLLHPNTTYSGKDTRRDTVIIQSEDGDITHKIPVAQLGKYEIKCINKVMLTDCFFCNFRYGKDVSYYRCVTIEGNDPYANDTDVLLMGLSLGTQSAKATSDQYHVKSSCKSDTDYTLYLITSSDTVSFWKESLTKELFHTASESNQPRASISNVRLQDNSWHYDVTMNQFCKGYYFAVLSGNYIGKSKAYIALRLYNLIEAGKIKQYETNKYAIHHTNNDIILASWAIGKDGKLSDVLEIYRASNSEEP